MEIKSIHTTVHLSKYNASILDENAEKLGIKRSHLVVLLMRKLLVRWKEMQCNFCSVQYQKSSSKDEWKTLHVFFSPVDYEVFTDMRNCFKWSVSALLAMAIREFLSQISDSDRRKFKWHYDNYQIYNYKCEGELNKNNFCWHITWELDKKFSEKIQR